MNINGMSCKVHLPIMSLYNYENKNGFSVYIYTNIQIHLPLSTYIHLNAHAHAHTHVAIDSIHACHMLVRGALTHRLRLDVPGRVLPHHAAREPKNCRFWSFS